LFLKKDLLNYVSFRPTKARSGWVWWCTFIIPVLGRLTKADFDFKAIPAT
jgi:hypothetical protein